MRKKLKGMTLIEGIISMVILLLAAGIMFSGFMVASKFAVRSQELKDTSSAAEYALNAASAYIENGKDTSIAVSEAMRLTNEKYPGSITASSINIGTGTALEGGAYAEGVFITVTAVCSNNESISITYTRFLPKKEDDPE